jgi:hypothetical protein
MAYSKANLKSSGSKASPSFRSFWDMKIITQIFSYADFTISFVETHFNQTN